MGDLQHTLADALAEAQRVAAEERALRAVVRAHMETLEAYRRQLQLDADQSLQRVQAAAARVAHGHHAA